MNLVLMYKPTKLKTSLVQIIRSVETLHRPHQPHRPTVWSFIQDHYSLIPFTHTSARVSIWKWHHLLRSPVPVVAFV